MFRISVSEKDTLNIPWIYALKRSNKEDWLIGYNKKEKIVTSSLTDVTVKYPFLTDV